MDVHVVYGQGSGEFAWRGVTEEGRIFLRSAKRNFTSEEDAQREAQRVLDALPECDILGGRETNPSPDNPFMISSISVGEESPPFGRIICTILATDGPHATYRWCILDEGGNPLAVHVESFVTFEYARDSCERAQASAVNTRVYMPDISTRVH